MAESLDKELKEIPVISGNGVFFFHLEFFYLEKLLVGTQHQCLISNFANEWKGFSIKYLYPISIAII